MGGLSPFHWALVLIAAVVMFGGRGRLSSIMGDAAKGIRAFQDGLKGEDASKTQATPSAGQIVQDKPADPSEPPKA